MEAFEGDCCSVQKQSSGGVFCKKGVLKNFVKLTEKHLCQSLFFIKLRTFFLKNTPGGCFCQFKILGSVLSRWKNVRAKFTRPFKSEFPQGIKLLGTEKANYFIEILFEFHV